METSTTRTPHDHAELECRRCARHFHQLFHNLRITKITVDNARLDAVIGDLGHVDNLFDGQLRVKKPEEVHQLLSQLRHRSIENLHKRADDVLMLHGVLQHPLLRPRVQDWPRPQPCGVFVKQHKVHRIPGHSFLRRDVRGLCTGGPLSPCGFVQVAPLTSLCAVVSGHRQCHCDGLLLMTPLSTQPPLPHALLPARVHIL